MRYLLYALGILVTMVGVYLVIDVTVETGELSNPALLVVFLVLSVKRVLIVLCGLVLFVGGAVVGAIESLRQPAPMPPSVPVYPHPEMPVQGPPPEHPIEQR